jgi:hypothetical protein
VTLVVNKIGLGADFDLFNDARLSRAAASSHSMRPEGNMPARWS